MRKFVSLAILSLLPAISATSGFEANNVNNQVCTYDTPNGQHYDLSSIGMSDVKIESFVGADGDDVFVRACGPSSSSPRQDNSVVIAKKRSGVYDLFIGAGSVYNPQWSSYSDRETDGVTILYSNGDKCDGSEDLRKTRVNFLCSNITQSNAKDDGCLMTINIETPAACPTDDTDLTCSPIRDTGDCLSVPNCACAWCEDKCIASSRISTCQGTLIMNCEADLPHSHGARGFILAASIISSLLVCSCCICLCSKRREQRRRLRKNLNLPNKFAPETQTQVQYVYIPMDNFGNETQHVPINFYPQMQGMQGVQYFMPQVPHQQ